MGLGDFLKGLATKANMGFSDFLNGKAAIPTDKIGQLKIGDDGIAQIDMGVSQNPRSGGFLQGFQENRTTPFAVENLEPNNKGWNFKLGEVAGTTARGIGKLGEGVGTGLKAVGRGLDSPLGRAALVGGIVGLTGGNPLQMLTYGATTGMMNQANRMKDQMYRRELAKYGFNTSGIGGYIGDDTFNKYLQSKQLQDNAEWRRANLEAQQAQQRALESYRNQQIAIDREKLKQLVEKGQNGNEYKNPKIILGQIEQAWEAMPQSKAIKGTSKAKAIQTGISTKLGVANNDVTSYSALKESMVTPLARAISQEKGNISDSDVKRARAMLPDEFDSYEQGKARINAINKLLIALENGEVAPANAEKYLQNLNSNQATTNEGWAF